MIIFRINLELLKKLEVFNGELKKMKKKCLNLEIEEKSRGNSSFYVRFEQKKEKKIKIPWREDAMRKSEIVGCA